MPCSRASLRSRTLRVTAADRFISDDRTRISLGDLYAGASIDPASARGRSVLIKTTKQLPTVLALLELDGVAQRVVLCPPDQWHHVPSIIQTAAINIVASDEQYEWIPMLHATCTARSSGAARPRRGDRMDTAHVGHHRPAENGDPHPSQPRWSPGGRRGGDRRGVEHVL